MLLILFLCTILGLVSSQQYVANDISNTHNGYKASLTLDSSLPNPSASKYPNTPWLQNVEFEGVFHSDDTFHFKISAPGRWQVPGVVQSQDPSTKPTNIGYSVSFVQKPFGLSITRKSDNVVVFDSSSSLFNSLILQDQYLEISTLVGENPNLYGLGERIQPLRLNPDDQTYTLFNRDVANAENTNMYGSHPFFLQMLADGSANGVFLLNSNPMDVVVNKNNGEYSVTYKTIGGVLDFYVFIGSTPQKVISSYFNIIGSPALQPYWALGPHQSRYGYHTLGAVSDVVSNYSYYKLPLETMWTDIDWMNKYYDFDWDPVRFNPTAVKAFVNKLHSNNQKYVVILDPGIPNQPGIGYRPYDLGEQMDVFWKKSDNKTDFVGYLWPGATTFPQFGSAQGKKYWATLVNEFLTEYQLDGLWCDMNEPTMATLEGEKESETINHLTKIESLCQTNCPVTFSPDSPPYSPGGEDLDSRTVPLGSKGFQGYMYNLHNMYGYHETVATHQGILQTYPNKRVFVLTRSQFPNSGSYVAVWGGDNNSNFNSLRISIAQMLNFNFFGITMCGVDMGGFNGDSWEDLVHRWYQAGVLAYPFLRNHNTKGTRSQEPYTFSTEMTNAARDLLHTRMSLLPYLYNLAFNAHANSETWIRPVWYEFPTGGVDSFYYDIQLMVGDSILLNPVVTQSVTTKTAYFPQHDKSTPITWWYDLYTGDIIDDGSSAGHQGQFGWYAGTWKTIQAPMDGTSIAHVRSGSILPLQPTFGKGYQASCPKVAQLASLSVNGSALTTSDSRQLPWSFIIAPDSTGRASGSFIIDDGESMDTVSSGAYSVVQLESAPYNSNTFQFTVSFSKRGYISSPATNPVGSVRIFNTKSKPTVVSCNNKPSQYSYTGTTLTIYPSSSTSLVEGIKCAWS